MAPKINLLLSLICRVHYAEQAIDVADVVRNCQTAEMHARVSKFNMMVSLIHGVLAAIVAPKLGILSDRIGRCPVLAISAIGSLISNLVLIIATKSTSVYGYRWILVGSFFEGMTGSIAAMMAAAHSYATDCTPAEKRAAAFGLFHASLFAGMAIGPAFGGYLVKVTGSILSTFYVAFLCQILFIIVVLFIIPESVSVQHRLNARDMHILDAEFNAVRPYTMRKFLRKLNFLEPLRVLVPGGAVRPAVRRNMQLLASIDTLLIGAGAGGMMVIILYAEFTFGWTSVEAGYFMSLGGTVRAFGLVVILPFIVKYLKSRDPFGQNHVGASYSDVTLIRFTTVCELVAFIGFAMAQTGVQFALAGTLGSIGGIASPTLQSALTKHVPKENVGALLGGLSLLHCICTIIAPIIFSTVYAYTISWYPRAIFFAFTVLYGLAFFCATMVKQTLNDSIYEEDYSERQATRYELSAPREAEPHAH
ncbi:major facilitator superfamily domain-containing protein [Lipomyces arxii]|uniref:major facilitator superfamily domain-containing protein n=1 Tax=Lipomyces arxii TaxID=56418 RepID=UPI0034CDEEFA